MGERPLAETLGESDRFWTWIGQTGCAMAARHRELSVSPVLGRLGEADRRLLQRKPLMLVAIALANKMARAIWAMMTKKEDYRDPARAVVA